MDYNAILSSILQAILVVALPILVTESARYIRARVAALEKQRPEDFYKIVEIAGIAVRAAEQLYSDNDEKLDYALEVAEKLLKRYGIELDLHELRALVEAEVHEFKASQGNDAASDSVPTAILPR